MAAYIFFMNPDNLFYWRAIIQLTKRTAKGEKFEKVRVALADPKCTTTLFAMCNYLAVNVEQIISMTKYLESEELLVCHMYL